MFFDLVINIISYVVKDFVFNFCVVVDSVMDIDYVVGCIIYDYVDEIIVYIIGNDLMLEWLIEIYVYVDYLFGVFYI